MAEYIEREAVLNVLNEELEFETSMYTAEQNKLINTGLKIAVRDVTRQPSADAVEVVRCKDCARCKKGYCTIRKDSWGAALLVGEHDFCSDGERKEK